MAFLNTREAENIEREERDIEFAKSIKKRMIKIVKDLIVTTTDEKTVRDLIDLHAYITKIKPDTTELFIYEDDE